MDKIDTQKLLNDKRVIEEIQRHLWIESEKAGHDIGFEKAREDWLNKFSRAWMAYNMPEALTKSPSKSSGAAEHKATPEKVAAPKKRRARSYL